MAKRKKSGKPKLGRSPMPPPSRPMDKDKYDRADERRQVEEEVDDALDQRREED